MLLEVKGLCVNYGHIEAIRDITFGVEEGTIATLIGANGAGKSTTLKTLSGLRKVRAGTITFDGKDITHLAPYERVIMGISQSPEGRGCFPGMTVRENLDMGAYVRKDRKSAAYKTDLDRVYDLFPRLKEREKQAAGSMSGGEQQMLAIGRALMTNPKLLILDEATEGLAPLIREEIWNCLSMLKARGQSVLVIDKNVGNLSRIADRHYIIERGRTVWSGSSAQLIAEPDLQHRYLGI